MGGGVAIENWVLTEKFDFFREEFMKNRYRGGDCLTRGGGTVCRFNGGLGKKEGDGVFEGGEV